MPEGMILTMKSKAKREWIICFLTVMILGLITHLYRFMNWLPNWDSLVYRYDELSMTHTGRIFAKVSCMLSSYYDLPWINGLISLIFIALGAISVCELFKLKNSISIVLVSGILVTFPTVASTFSFSFTADGYFIAFFCTCYAVPLIDSKGIGKTIAGILLMAFALGIYQAYITVSVMLILVYLLYLTVLKPEPLKVIVKKLAVFMLSGIAAAALYWISVKVFLLISGNALTEYQGVAEAFNLAHINIIASVLLCRNYFIEYFFSFANGITLFTVLNILMFVIMAVFGLMTLFKKEVRSAGRIACAVILVGLMPFGTRLLLFIDCNMDYHNLTLMGCALFYILMILLYEKLEFKSKKLNLVKQWSIFIVASLMIYNFVLISNISYHTMQLAYEKSYSVATRMTDRIEQTPDIEKCDKIAVIGMLPGSEAYSLDITPDMTGFTDGYIMRETDEVIADQFVVATMLREYCGLELENADENETKAFMQTEEFKEMKPWPARESVRVYDKTVVIYLGE